MDEASIISDLIKSGPVVAVLVLWIWNQDKKTSAHIDKIQANADKLITQLQEERLANLNEQKAHMKACDEDRQNLREELVRLSHKIISKGTPKDEWPVDPPTVRDIKAQLKINQEIIAERML